MNTTSQIWIPKRDKGKIEGKARNKDLAQREAIAEYFVEFVSLLKDLAQREAIAKYFVEFVSLLNDS